ncbi:hypothetical protein EV1_000156 [Malus domestica]
MLENLSMNNGTQGPSGWTREDFHSLLLASSPPPGLLGWLVKPGFYIVLPMLPEVRARDNIVVLHPGLLGNRRRRRRRDEMLSNFNACIGFWRGKLRLWGCCGG